MLKNSYEASQAASASGRSQVSRRRFLAGSGAASAAAFQIIKPELVRGQGRRKLTAGIIGCGGRGTRGVAEMITGAPNIELVAMADLFEDQLEKSLRRLRDSDEFSPEVKANIKVDPENRLVASELERVGQIYRTVQVLGRMYEIDEHRLARRKQQEKRKKGPARPSRWWPYHNKQVSVPLASIRILTFVIVFGRSVGIPS